LKIDPFFSPSVKGIKNKILTQFKMITNTVFNSKSLLAFLNESEESKSDMPTINLAPSKDWIKNSHIQITGDGRVIGGKFGKNLNLAFRGPTHDSNILIPGRLTVGGYPTSENMVQLIKASGVTHFVCLNTLQEYGNVAEDFPAYAADFEAGAFILFPIVDMSASAADDALKSLCERLRDMILAGKHLFVHCAGGHGRTGTVVAILLKMLYSDLSTYDIFDYIQYSHDQRTYHNYGTKKFTGKITDPDLSAQFAVGQVPTPQTSAQRDQVIRVSNAIA
jgi:hypothetical protein